MRKRTHLGLALAALALTASCAAHRVRIADLKDQPGRYDHKTVSVSGVVTSSFAIPFAPFQVYNVDDGSGQITVLSQSQRILTKGARVDVRGRLNQVASVGDRSLGLHLEERKRTVR